MAKPIIPYLGGKRRLAKLILKDLPDHTCYVEVFAGGGAIYFEKEPVQTDVINDINGELMNLYRVVQRHLEEFVRQFKWMLSSRQLFNWMQTTEPETLTDIERAARFFFLQKHAFGGRVQTQAFGTATTAAAPFNLLRIEESLSQAHLRLKGAYIEHLSWQACIKKYDRSHTLFYLDPPYWKTEGYGFSFEWDQYVDMKELMQSMQGKCILSINKHHDIVELFAGFRQVDVQIDYIVGGNSKPKKATELIIYNW